MKQIFDRCHGGNREVTVLIGWAPVPGFLGVVPLFNHILAHSEGETALLFQRGIVLLPVADPVSCFGGGFHGQAQFVDKENLSSFPFMQQRP
jgi:hypothetical protein